MHRHVRRNKISRPRIAADCCRSRETRLSRLAKPIARSRKSRKPRDRVSSAEDIWHLRRASRQRSELFCWNNLPSSFSNDTFEPRLNNKTRIGYLGRDEYKMHANSTCEDRLSNLYAQSSFNAQLTFSCQMLKYLSQL